MLKAEAPRILSTKRWKNQWGPGRLQRTYQRIVRGEKKTGMEPLGKRHWRVKKEDQKTGNHALANESRPG
eukprot:558650-Pelagomonas_calceolata.AAC.1